MPEIEEIYIGIDKRLLPTLKKFAAELSNHTVLEQQILIEMLVSRHILRAAYPNADKIADTMEDLFRHVAQMTLTSLSESRGRKNQS